MFLPRKSHGRRNLVGCSPWGRWGLGTTERLHYHFSLSCMGEGNGNPLQCSCLENLRDGGAWWAAVSGVAQSQTRLKQLSSSSSNIQLCSSGCPLLQWTQSNLHIRWPSLLLRAFLSHWTLFFSSDPLIFNPPLPFISVFSWQFSYWGLFQIMLSYPITKLQAS